VISLGVAEVRDGEYGRRMLREMFDVLVFRLDRKQLIQPAAPAHLASCRGI
jgi:hypothetical protein